MIVWSWGQIWEMKFSNIVYRELMYFFPHEIWKDVLTLTEITLVLKEVHLWSDIVSSVWDVVYLSWENISYMSNWYYETGIWEVQPEDMYFRISWSNGSITMAHIQRIIKNQEQRLNGKCCSNWTKTTVRKRQSTGKYCITDLIKWKLKCQYYRSCKSILR